MKCLYRIINEEEGRYRLIGVMNRAKADAIMEGRPAVLTSPYTCILKCDGYDRECRDYTPKEEYLR